MPKSSFYHQTKQATVRADSSVWYECLTCTDFSLDDFENWLLKNHSRHYSKECMRYVRRYHDVLRNPRKISQIGALGKDQKRMAMAGLANLSKYLGCYEYWRTLVKNAGLRWEKKVSLDIVLDIMNTNLQDCWVWLKQVLENTPILPR